MSEATVAWKYKGPGYYYGIPDHDLTADEFDALQPEQQAMVREAKEYTEVERTQPEPPRQAEKKGGTA